MRGPLIELHGVGRRYEIGGSEVVALAEVDLCVEAEEFVVVLGPSGSGKTTLLNVIGALDSPTEGRVVVAGQDITGASRKELFAFRRHGVSFVFQTFNLFPALTAQENVEFGADVAGRDDARTVAAEMLARVGLAHRLRHFPHELSGGEQQRVAIARAFANRPRILFADEPTGNLDSDTGSRIVELLETLNSESGSTVVLVTHDLTLAKRARRIIRLSDGLVVSDEPTIADPSRTPLGTLEPTETR